MPSSFLFVHLAAMAGGWMQLPALGLGSGTRLLLRAASALKPLQRFVYKVLTANIHHEENQEECDVLGLFRNRR